MKSLTSVLAGAFVLLACATSAYAVTNAGTNFDGRMSLIYNDVNGGVFIENSPHPNPSVQSLTINSFGGNLLPGNIHGSVASYVVGTPTAKTIQLSHTSNFTGTAGVLGAILSAGYSELALLNDLTISYNQFNVAPTEGDLIWGSYGQLQIDPVLPTNGPAGGCCRFFNVSSGQFFDPPMAYGFEFTMDSPSLFTKAGMPLGLGDLFRVESSEGVEFVGEGGQVEFTGVSSFTVTGIDPLADPDDQEAFPVYLEFSQQSGNFFTMSPILIPEPSAVALMSLAMCAALSGARRRG